MKIALIIKSKRFYEIKALRVQRRRLMSVCTTTLLKETLEETLNDNHDLNIDQNNSDYDLLPNQAAVYFYEALINVL